MARLRGPLCDGDARHLLVKLRGLGLDDDKELRALLSLVKTTRAVQRGEDILKFGNLQKTLTVLLSGVACRYRMMDNGRRQILAFQYPGDACDYHRYVLSTQDDPVAAVTDCLVGTLDHDDLESLLQQHPRIAFALWRATVLEARILLERVSNATQNPAVERIANLLCEQVLRLERSGMSADVIPLTQIDLADAAGLSVVHVNRTIQELRELGALARNSHGIRVENRDRLIQIAKFDATYLDIGRTAALGPPL
jgi:CRP-like cAMP-binding protein